MAEKELKTKKEIFSYLWEKIKLAFVLKDGTKVLSSNDFTTDDKSKLSQIEEGAQVNVQADWNSTEGDSLILNKPTIPQALSELENDSGYIVGDLSQLNTDEKENIILAINELFEKINSLKGGTGGEGLTFSEVTLKNGTIIYKGSDGIYYTSKDSNKIVSAGEYELNDGRILLVYSDGTGIINDAPSVVPSKKMTTYVADFSSISNVENDSYGWYELSSVDNKLQAILREPDATEALACFIVNMPSELDLSEGAYVSINITGIQNGTTTASSGWNQYSCFSMRLRDSAGNYSNWIDFDAKGIGKYSDGISYEKKLIMTSRADMSTYLGSTIDRSSIVAAEMEIIGWPSATITYKPRDKGVTIDNFSLSRTATETAEEGAASQGGSNQGGENPGGNNTNGKMTTWVEEFSTSLCVVENDENNWYELDIIDGKLRTILREPDATEKYATFFINIPKTMDLSSGAYLSIEINSINTDPGTPVGTASWNNGNCFNLRLIDTSGGVSSWIPFCPDGIGHSAGIMPEGCSIDKVNISTYLGDIDTSNICKLEISLIGWLTYETVTYKNRNKGVTIDNIRLSRNTTETAEEGAGGSSSDTPSENKEFKRIASTYSNLSSSDWNDIADVYSSVKTSQGDRLMILVRHSERDSATGKDAGLNANGLKILQETAAPKLVGAPFADSSKDVYFSSNIKRTVETAYFIGNARGASGCTSSSLLGSNWESETAVDHSGDPGSSISWVAQTPGPHTYFNDHFTGGTNWSTVQNYYKDSKTTCDNDCTAAINWLAEKTEGHPFTFVGSHDLCMVPFVCWAADNGDMFSTWNNDYDSNPTGWIMYMAGIAVIVHSNGNWETYPIYCLDKPKFT